MINKTEISIYILKLENQCYYVGQAIDVEKRINEHKNMNGSRWTTLHPLIEILDCFSANTSDVRISGEIEDKTTIDMMIKFGWKNVRGGYLNHIDEEYIKTTIIKHKIAGIYEKLCVEDANNGIKKFPSKNDFPWLPDELKFAIDNYAKGTPLNEIAKQCSRTESAIKIKIKKTLSKNINT
jgi:predicted GIY-YIG superfamily endonuclease